MEMSEKERKGRGDENLGRIGGIEDKAINKVIAQSKLPPVKKKSTVQEHFDDLNHLLYRGMEIKFTEISWMSAYPLLERTYVAS